MQRIKKINRLTVLDKSTLINNPLISDDFIINIRKIVAEKSYKIDSEGMMIPVELELESDTKVNVYTLPEYRKLIALCSASAKSLYIHILHEVEYGSDYIEINVNRYMKENNVLSINTYKSGIQELSRYLIIYPSLIKGVYWINPRLFFAGSRVKKYPKNVVIK
jgi:hypothetical protein